MAYTRFKVIGKVRGKARPRHTRKGVTYTVKEDRKYEASIRKAYLKAGGIRYPKDTPMFVSVSVHRSLPESKPKKVISEEDLIKPDVDNILKAVMDALNGYAYADDKQVVMASIYKAPRTRCVEHLEIYVGTNQWEDED